jgi:hypothetical protein
VSAILTNRIKRKCQRELIKRSLTEFFVAKGYDNFNMPLYPPAAYDLPARIPHLFTRCEIVPSVEETDTTLGTVKLMWNLFILGTQRLSLGSTVHSGQADIVRAIVGEPNMELPSEPLTTPKKVIEFILKILDSSKSGYVELPANFQVPPGALTMPLISKSRSSRLNPSSSGSFY